MHVPVDVSRQSVHSDLPLAVIYHGLESGGKLDHPFEVHSRGTVGCLPDEVGQQEEQG